MEAPPKPPEAPGIGIGDVAYLGISVAVFLTLVLLIWPTSTASPTWARTMSDEVRFLAIAAAGGALGSVLRDNLALGRGIAFRTAVRQRVLGHVVRWLLAVQLAILLYLAFRAFLLLPTTPVTAFSPFGVLALGFLAGMVAETAMPQIVASVRGQFERGAVLESRIDQIARAVGATMLDNYQGALCAVLLDAERQPITPIVTTAGDTAPFPLVPNRRYFLQVWLAPTQSEASAAQAISITGGNDTSRVSFVVVADSSAAVRFVPGRRTFTFDPERVSDRAEFEFVAPVVEAPFTLWVRALQKDRLAAVLSVEAEPVPKS